VVAALAHGSTPNRLVATSADVGFVTPHDREQAGAIVAEIRAAQEDAGRAAETVHVFGDLVVFLDERARGAATARPGSTISPGPSTTATPSSMPGRRCGWPTCCRTGPRPGCPDSGCGRPAPATTCR
jgi:alkanesulfonate monooxygenase SsuD/methylene tetrahydromethanopterin reductase-like flavin-dependent oxidoreductase (luciferase family)